MMQLHLNPTQFKASNTDPTTAVLNLPLYTHTYQGNLLHYTFNLALYTHTWNGNLLYYTFNLALSTHTSAGNLLHYTFNLPLYTHTSAGNLLHCTLNTAIVDPLEGIRIAANTQLGQCAYSFPFLAGAEGEGGVELPVVAQPFVFNSHFLIL